MFRSQQIQIMKTLVTLLFITMAAVGQAKALTANDILTSCEALLRNFKPLGGEQMSIPNQGAQCAGYISAFQGLSVLIENNNDGSGRILKICAPPESTLVQFIRIYVNYAQANPRLLHQDAAELVLAALRKAFPCS
jgi:Rap1a immunity proteins